MQQLVAKSQSISIMQPNAQSGKVEVAWVPGLWQCNLQRTTSDLAQIHDQGGEKAAHFNANEPKAAGPLWQKARASTNWDEAARIFSHKAPGSRVESVGAVADGVARTLDGLYLSRSADLAQQRIQINLGHLFQSLSAARRGGANSPLQRPVPHVPALQTTHNISITHHIQHISQH